MGVLRPLIGKGLEIAPADARPSDRVLTPANCMTAARPVLALKAARMLIRGERPVTPWIALMGLSDAEGNLARFIDRVAPDSGLGTSTRGAELDPVADTAAILIVGSAAMFAPRMPKAGRAAVAGALGHEGIKAAWAIRKNNLYQEVSGERLAITPTIAGKEAMAEKFGAVGFAVLASDFDNRYVRGGLSMAAMAMAASGTLRSEGERLAYDVLASGMIADAMLTNGLQPAESQD